MTSRIFRVARPMLATIAALAVFQSGLTSSTWAFAQTLPTGDDARVTQVISADSLNVQINKTGFTIGLIGLDAPNVATAQSKAECYANQAQAFTRRLVQGKTLRVVRDSTDFDANGRLMRYVYLPDGQLLNEVLVRGGYARVVAVAPDVQMQAQLQQAEQQAQAAKVGLWKACAAAPAQPPVTATVVPVAAGVVAVPAGACVAIELKSLIEHGPRPAALENLPAGRCVTITSWRASGNFSWIPAGTRFHLDRQMLVRWADDMKPVYRDSEGHFATLEIYRTTEGYFNTPVFKDALHPIEFDGRYYKLFNGTLIFENADNNEVVALVDVLQHESGSFYTQRFFYDKLGWVDDAGNRTT